MSRPIPRGNEVHKGCDLVNVDRVVTDREPRPEIRRAMEAADVELIVADRGA